MKRNNKKGFTIVELVIVIAVIAILAAVLIPNLSRLVDKANKSARLQEVESALKVMLMTQKDGALDEDTVFEITKNGKTYYYVYDGSQLGEETEQKPTLPANPVTKDSDTLTIATKSYTIEKISELGSFTVYLSDADALAIDGIVETTNP